ncbi:hypothetical protein PILCRDRAFT_245452 [Piloderma croceum F 1598]|uniref:Uncharacterized protein n=1 Tax=Piloderma croceum (strain F 1598) TaxID=765440 RepID=A0A0C3GE74_PILCF|nr:hypothetical protein PILCRDRAFT_245452 [Piloderma croceum F 1598]
MEISKIHPCAIRLAYLTVERVIQNISCGLLLKPLDEFSFVTICRMMILNLYYKERSPSPRYHHWHRHPNRRDKPTTLGFERQW